MNLIKFIYVLSYGLSAYNTKWSPVFSLITGLTLLILLNRALDLRKHVIGRYPNASPLIPHLPVPHCNDFQALLFRVVHTNIVHPFSLIIQEAVSWYVVHHLLEEDAPLTSCQVLSSDHVLNIYGRVNSI